MAKNSSGLSRVEQVRSLLLDSVLPYVAFEGWSERALCQAAISAGVDSRLVRLAFPEGAIDALQAYHRRADACVAADATCVAAASRRVRDKVRNVTRMRLQRMSDQREAVRRGFLLWMTPFHGLRGSTTLWETADMIWTVCGDRSVDSSHFTKRATLAGIYGAVLGAWVYDESQGAADSLIFLDQCLDRAASQGKAGAFLRSTRLGQLVSPLLSRLFSGSRGFCLDHTDLPGQRAHYE